LISVIIN